MNRPVLLLAPSLLALLACRSDSAATTPPARMSVPASAAPSASVVAAPTHPERTTATFVGHAAHVVPRPNGHLLVTTADHVLDWDTSSNASPRPASLGPDVASVFLHPTSPRFVVARASGDATTLELWDAAGLAPLPALDGTWRGGDGVAAFSPSGNRFLFFGCVSRPRGDRSDCDAAVYDLPDGKLVHRTRVPALQTGIYLTSVQLSPSGRYFSLAHENFPTQIRETETGKLVFESAAPEGYLNGSGFRLHFVDDTHALVGGAKWTLADLATPNASRQLDLEVARTDQILEHELAPDRRTVALLLVRDVRCRVITWSLESGVRTSQLLPPEAGPGCSMRWVDASHLVVQRGDGTGRTQIRLDVAAKTQASEPLVPRPALEAHGFSLYGDFAASDGAIRMRGSGSATPVGPSYVLTPRGAKVMVDAPINQSWVVVEDDRLVLVTDDAGITVIRDDGTTAHLLPAVVRKR